MEVAEIVVVILVYIASKVYCHYKSINMCTRDAIVLIGYKGNAYK